MKLYIFPEAPVPDNGFGIAVADAFQRLQPQPGDVVIWYTQKKDFALLRPEHHLIYKSAAYAPRRVANVLMGRPSHQLATKSLNWLRQMEFDDIHCDDTTFFCTLRKLFPQKHITVRFHNCYARIEDRRRLLQLPLSTKFRLVLKAYFEAERAIMADRNSTKIFLTWEDCNYYRAHFGITSDSCVWPGYEYETLQAQRTRSPLGQVDKLVWFGGVESHKVNSIRWFIDQVFTRLKASYPYLSFHLYGAGTAQFDNPQENIFGHGFYQGQGIPDKGCSLYVNPDIIGSGIKLKLTTYMKAGVPFITSPFGFEGYPKELADDYCIISELNHWVDDISQFIDHNSKNTVFTDSHKK